MKTVVLFWIFLKSTSTSFAGLASLPEIREELVDKRHMLTDEQLNASVVITRSTPGPVGVYVVSVGYMANGIPGAIAGWLAMSLPSLVIILLVGYVGRRAEHPRIRGLLQAVVLASATLLVLAAIPLGRDALQNPFMVGIAAVSLALLFYKKVDTLWVVGGAALISLVASLAGLPGVGG